VLVARGKVLQLPDNPGTGWQVNELDSLSIIFRALEALAAASASIYWIGVDINAATTPASLGLLPLSVE